MECICSEDTVAFYSHLFLLLTQWYNLKESTGLEAELDMLQVSHNSVSCERFMCLELVQSRLLAAHITDYLCKYQND